MTRGSDCTSGRGALDELLRPGRGRATRSHRLKMKRMSCSMTRTARPWSRIAKIRSSAWPGLLRVHAGGGLVEQQELRVGGQRAGDLEPALVAVGRGCGRGGRPCRPRPDEVEQLLARSRGVALPRGGSRGRGGWRDRRPVLGPAVPADHDVLEDGHVARRAGCSGRCGPCRPGRPGRGLRRQHGRRRSVTCAFGRHVQAGEAVEEGGLAGAVGADEADDLALARP